MAVLNLRRLWKYTLLVAVVAILSVSLIGVMQHGRDWQSSKADRTNAMQVVKPIAAEQSVIAAVPDFFTEYRLERDRVRSERSDVLREAIKNAKTDDSRQKAQDAVLKLVLEKQREMEMENLIKARGFSDALVFMRDSSVSAVVKTQSLSREDVLQVADVISRVAGVKSEDITISAKP